jgi:hypothetical protein
MSKQRSGLRSHQRRYNCCTSFTQTHIHDIVPTDPIPQIVTTDLLIHFEANDPNSYDGNGTTWVNIGTGGSTYNATLLGDPLPTFDNDTIKSFHFTGYLLNSGDAYENHNYMQFLRPDAISDDFTYCAWIKTTSAGYGMNHYELMYIVSTETGEVNDDFGFGLDSEGYLSYGDGKLGEGEIDITIHSNQQVNTGYWTFVAVTREKSTGEVILYINGIQDTIGTCNVENTLSTSTYVLIGSETDHPGYTFDGYIGAILGNTSVLTPEQIMTNYNAQKSIYGL